MKYDRCRHCDRSGEQEISECPSANSCACSALQSDRWLQGVMKQSAIHEREMKATGNYVADKEVNPRKVTFANGRVVRIVRGALVVEWAKPKKPKTPPTR